MTDLAKLASNLVVTADFIKCGVCETHEAESLLEAAAILRAAAGADVNGLMEMAHACSKAWVEYAKCGGGSGTMQHWGEKRAALESALRLALAKGQP